MITITSCDFEKINDSVKGLADLLWAMVAQIEAESSLRFEGAFMLAKIASDIEDMLNSVSEEDSNAVKGGDAA